MEELSKRRFSKLTSPTTKRNPDRDAPQAWPGFGAERSWGRGMGVTGQFNTIKNFIRLVQRHLDLDHIPACVVSDA